MDPLHYLHLQLRLECKEVINERFIREVEVIPEEELPLILIAQFADEKQVVYYDEAIARDFQKRLAAATMANIFPNIRPLLEVLEKQNTSFSIGHYKTYIFPSVPVKDSDVNCVSKHDERVKAFGFDGFAEQVHVVERDGKVVSACVSARENDACGEAWVFTSPEYRSHGFAQRVVNAWAGRLMNAGKVPFYSHKIENVASTNLARALKLHPVFEEIAILRA